MTWKLIPLICLLFSNILYAQQDSVIDSPSLFKYTIVNPIAAKVKAKPNKSSSPEWSVYRDKNLTVVVGKVSAGQSVSITDWDYQLYYVKTLFIEGYIPFLAVSENPKLDSLSQIVSKYANLETENRLRKTLLEKIPIANLRVNTDKKEIYVGECTTVNLSFNVNGRNKTKLQFVDLEKQIPPIKFVNSQITHCWSIDSKMSDLKETLQNIGKENYLCYTLKKIVLCPSQGSDIQIPALEFYLKRYTYQIGDDFEITKFHSEPFTIKVKALPEGTKPSSYDFFKLVGEFTLEDSLSSLEAKTYESVLYKITISGKGLTFPIDPPKIVLDNAISELVEIQSGYTLRSDIYYSERSFIYSITFTKEGFYDFKDKVAFKVFDPLKKRVIALSSNDKIKVVGGQTSIPYKRQGVLNTYDNLILLDISPSMMMEDYKPNRLKSVTIGIKEFLLNRKLCDIGVITFSGDAKPYKIAKPDSCYSAELISNIEFAEANVGTAIGDAIWVAKNSLHRSANSKLVIIGDGDNTAGNCAPDIAIAIAKKYNIKIYTIGVGTKELAPMGYDKFGNPQLYEKSFDDKLLKNISLRTGGKYYWAKDASQIGVILKSIFP